jgi:hypothetical protein
MKDAKGHGSNKRGTAAAFMARTQAITKTVKVKPDVLKHIQNNPGGFSVSPKGKTPTAGYMVSLPGRTRIVTEDQLRSPEGHKILQDFAHQNSDVLKVKGAHIGGWTDKASGKTYLDVSHNIKDESKAVAAGRAHNQIAIWDVKRAREIATGGTGE